MGAYELGLQSNGLKDFSVTIDGVQLTLSQTKSLKMKWNINNFKVLGEIVFEDLANMVENLPIRGNNTVVMTMTDFDDIPSKQEFKVTDVMYTRTKKGHPAVKLTLVDPITLTAMQMYNEMSWKKEDMVNIIDHDETLKPDLVVKKKDFFSPEYKHENFVMPLHVPFNVVAHWLAKHNNVLWYQTRDDYVLQPLKELFGRGKQGEKFRYKTHNMLYRRRIYEYRANYGKLIETNAFQTDGKVASFSPDSKHAKWEVNSFKKSLEDISSTGLTPQDLPGTGDKHFYKSDYNIKEVTEFMWQKNAYKGLELEILVPGQFDTNIGDIVELDLVNYNKDTEPEANINGLWLIEEIVDLINPPDFVQRIKLTRAKFSK